MFRGKALSRKELASALSGSTLWSTAQALGTPTFDAKGRILGISVQNFANGRSTGLVVLPAADIAEIAKQAAAIQAKPKAAEVEAPKQIEIPVKAESVPAGL